MSFLKKTYAILEPGSTDVWYFMHEDTIASISTPQGTGGIGIVRMSGDRAFEIALKLFRTPQGRRLDCLETHRIYYGHAVSREGRLLDTVILLPMMSPKSYTREDVAEFQCHGGLMSVRVILEAVLACGARLAEPGEFTKRAYLNGRLDLVQAESVIKLIRSMTDRSMNMALNQLNGGLSGAIRDIKEEYIRIGSVLETRIEFFEEDVNAGENEAILADVKGIQDRITSLVDSYRKGKFLVEGLSVVLAGCPNVGKSSLMNALLNENRSIVTDIPGTTRDFIVETIPLDGVPFRIIDTAGISHTDDSIELEGIRRSFEKIDGADLILFIIDSGVGITELDREISNRLDKSRTVVVLNKCDLVGKVTLSHVRELGFSEAPVFVSALKSVGISELKSALVKKSGMDENLEHEGVLVSSERQVIALKEALEAGYRFISCLTSGFSEELVMIDVWNAIHALDKVTGETCADDILEDIFSRFCIGK